MNKSQLIRLIGIGCVFLLPVLLGVVGFIYLMTPEFPDSIPSSDQVDAKDVNHLEQIRIFDNLTQYLRDNHGGIVVSEQIDKYNNSPKEREFGLLAFRHKYRSIDDELILRLIRKFSQSEQIAYQIKKYSYKNKTLNKPDSYEILFLKESKPWMSVKLEWEDDSHYRSKSEMQYTEVTEATEIDQEEPISKPGDEAHLIIIIDDLGSNMEILNNLIALDFEITYSILPQLPHSIETAELVNKAGHDIMLHLPMQPKDWPRFNPGVGALLITDDTNTIKEKMEQNLRSVPYAVGINNHMGSAYTQHAEGLDVLMEILKNHNLFFLDSKTAPGNIAKKSAKQNNVTYLSRNIFLDNIQKEYYVKNQLQKAVNLSKKWGKAIAIGHPYQITCQVLARQLPLLADEGVKVIRVSDVIPQ
ncbi:divergent polysaccharide deacetylase family protein [bacterium]|nr:divergent polysaccharide deacetylase family protein [bacterium]